MRGGGGGELCKKWRALICTEQKVHSPRGSGGDESEGRGRGGRSGLSTKFPLEISVFPLLPSLPLSLSPFLAPPSLIRLLILAMMRELFLRSKEEGVTEGERDRRF